MTWRTIDSAPRDGTQILLFWPGGAYYEVVCGQKVYVGIWRENGRVGKSWFTDTIEWDDYDLEHNTPTHWQPLPAPPEDET